MTTTTDAPFVNFVSRLDVVLSKVTDNVRNSTAFAATMSPAELPPLMELYSFAEAGIQWHAVDSIKIIEDLWNMRIRPNEVWTSHLMRLTRELRLHLYGGALGVTWEELIVAMAASMDVYGTTGDRIAADAWIDRYPTTTVWTTVLTKNPWLVTLMLLGLAQPIALAAEVSHGMRPPAKGTAVKSGPTM